MSWNVMHWFRSIKWLSNSGSFEVHLRRLFCW